MKKRIQILEVPRMVLNSPEVYTGSNNRIVDMLNAECWLSALAQDENGNLHRAYWSSADEDEAVVMFECGLVPANLIIRYDEEGRAFDVTWGTEIWATKELEDAICDEGLDEDFDF